jgi:hypothetical protein
VKCCRFLFIASPKIFYFAAGMAPLLTPRFRASTPVSRLRSIQWLIRPHAA